MRVLRLQGQSLPYRPVSWSGKQRVITKWYGGNPEATQQVLGPIEEPTTDVKGAWRLRKLANDPAVLVENEQRFSLNTPELVRDAMESIGRSGQEVRVSWGGIIRFGRIATWKFTHHRLEDIDWEVTFDWKSRGQKVNRVSDTELIRNLSFLETVFQAFADAANAMERVNNIAEDTADEVIRRGRLVQAGVSRAVALVDRTVKNVKLPLEVINSFVAISSNIRSQVRGIVDEVGNTPAELTATSDNATDMLKSWTAFHTTRQNAEQVARESRRQEDDRLRRVKPQYLDVVVGRQGQSLRDLSRRYYGTSDSWQLIADANGLANSFLEGGEVILIPVRT